MMRKFKKINTFIILLLAIIFVLTSCTQNLSDRNVVNVSSVSSVSQDLDNNSLVISYLDVGQGDSIFIILPNGETLLIDAGNLNNGSEIIQYIKDSGQSTLDYVVATHPHADHIGGMAEVINAFEVKKIYMPKAPHTSVTFEHLLQTISEKGLQIQTAKAGKIIFDYGDLEAIFLAPNSDEYTDLNNYSAVVMLTYKDMRFLFMGDAESESEKEILSAGFDVDADVLKVGHHGSSSSTTQDFLKEVSPSIAVISVGINNSYGHPDDDVLERLNKAHINVHRTDESGTIVITCDGTDIILNNSLSPQQNTHSFLTSSYSSANSITTSDGQNLTVYITRTGTKYHLDGCRYLNDSKIPVLLNEINTDKYSPCKICNPPLP